MRTKGEYTVPLMGFAELDITSNFTFLRGASHAEEYVRRAALLGIGALAIADENSVAGVVRAHVAVREVAREVRLRAEAVRRLLTGREDKRVDPRQRQQVRSESLRCLGADE